MKTYILVSKIFMTIFTGPEAIGDPENGKWRGERGVEGRGSGHKIF